MFCIFRRSVGGYSNQFIFFFVGSKNSIFFEGFVIFCTKSKEPLIYFVYVYLLYFYSGCNLKLNEVFMVSYRLEQDLQIILLSLAAKTKRKF